jgi:glutathione S-transferase
MVLAEKGVTYERREVNPFAADVPKEYLDLNPFGRVPTLVHRDFVLYETNVITRYIDEAFAGPLLQPTEPRQRARMSQIISILDAYGYVPMVRQVFSHRVFGPRVGRTVDEAQICVGIENSLRVLSALESIIALNGPVAGGAAWSLADFHLAPMMAYFTAAPEGEKAMALHTKLSAWWDVIRRRSAFSHTDPGLPDGPRTSAPASPFLAHCRSRYASSNDRGPHPSETFPQRPSMTVLPGLPFAVSPFNWWEARESGLRPKAQVAPERAVAQATMDQCGGSGRALC